MNVNSQDRDTTKDVVEDFYAAFLRGDADAMLSMMSETVEVRFLAQADLKGISHAREFFAFSGGLLSDLEFRIHEQIFDGEWAATIWTESGKVSATGRSWTNHGVDLIRVEEGRVTVVHENNDVRLVSEHLPKYEFGG
ncbi:MAG: hypothetical protein CL459_00860 [Acidimicrobiaceae bacterium]|nr:hypothetical protein [Acidimicrobiaceae bacterium]HAQ24077.1 hypothetical protein [Acidimicrobiaceae bacterium]|tara:strand:+ start:1261 stop:1674 length:414 start_codon:yes stop_codon:yes gene_type:complete